jgi:hypothetical protein
MKVSEVFSIVRECVKRHFEQGVVVSNMCDPDPENRYWIDILIDGAFFKEIDRLLDDLSSRLMVDKGEFMIWTSEELKDEIGVGFYLPYLRTLSEDEARARYVYVEGDYRDYFPAVGEKLYVISKGETYEARIDLNSRIFLTQWFKDNSVGVGDTVCLWCVDWGSKKYVANVRRVGSGVVK